MPIRFTLFSKALSAARVALELSLSKLLTTGTQVHAPIARSLQLTPTAVAWSQLYGATNMKFYSEKTSSSAEGEALAAAVVSQTTALTALTPELERLDSANGATATRVLAQLANILNTTREAYSAFDSHRHGGATGPTTTGSASRTPVLGIASLFGRIEYLSSERTEYTPFARLLTAARLALEPSVRMLPDTMDGKIDRPSKFRLMLMNVPTAAAWRDKHSATHSLLASDTDIRDSAEGKALLDTLLEKTLVLQALIPLLEILHTLEPNFVQRRLAPLSCVLLSTTEAYARFNTHFAQRLNTDAGKAGSVDSDWEVVLDANAGKEKTADEAGGKATSETEWEEVRQPVSSGAPGSRQ